MDMIALLYRLVQGAVIVVLLAGLLCSTKAIKAKDNKTEQKHHIRRASLFFFIYVALNFVRMYMEGTLL